MRPVKYLALSLLLFISSTSFAHKRKIIDKLFGGTILLVNDFDLSLEAGPGISAMFGIKNDPTPCVSDGLNFQYNVPKIFLKRLFFSVITSLYYDRKGDQKSISYPYGGANINEHIVYRLNLNYLTVPVLFKTSYILPKGLLLFLDAGPYLSVMAKADATLSNGAPAFFSSNNLKSIDGGVDAGIGVTIPFGKLFDLSIEDRNSVGLLNISRLPVIDNETIKTFSSVLLVGFHYKFGKHDYKKG